MANYEKWIRAKAAKSCHQPLTPRITVNSVTRVSEIERPPGGVALADFLRHNHRAALFCRDDAGRPIGYPMRSLTYENRRLYFATYTKSAKVRHLLAEPEAACVVTSEDGARWVSVQGRAEVYRPSPTEIETILQRSTPERRVSDALVAAVEDRLASGKRSFIRLEVDRVRAHVE
jgi:uncharacterized pyridoxamine 5'-phosphate oxidase family protein